MMDETELFHRCKVQAPIKKWCPPWLSPIPPTTNPRMGSKISKAKRPTPAHQRRTRDTARLPSITPTIYSNILDNRTPCLCGNQDHHQPQSSARYHRRDLGSSRRPEIPPSLCSGVEIVGSIVPATSLPRRQLRFEGCQQMVHVVPGAGGKSRPSRQESIHMDHGDVPCS